MKAQPRLLRTLLGGLSSLLAAHAYASGSPIPDYYDQAGLSAYRENIASEDAAESIDPFSGHLHLNHVDIDIPGNGGLDLKVTRTYDNVQLFPNQAQEGPMGLGWDVQFGRVLINPSRGICDQTVGTSHTSNTDHVLQLPDGSQQTLFVADASPYTSFIYVTPQKYVAACTTAVGGGEGLIVTSPEGTSYYMTQPTTGGAPQPALLATKIVDRNGNSMTINYVTAGGSLGLTVIGSVSTSDGRSVQFNYANQTANNYYLSSITAGGYTWSFQYQQLTQFQFPTYELTQVTRPDGTTWKYAYFPSTATAGAYSMETLTYPHGAVANYTYQNINFGYAATSTSIATKSVSGPSLTPGSWTYHFAPSSSYDTTTITGPNVSFTYKHIGYMAAANNIALIWEVGCLLEKDMSGGGATQDETYTWANELISDQAQGLQGGTQYDTQGSYAPLMTEHVITRDGTAYTTAFSNFDSYGNAQSVSESGPAGSRSTSYTYLTDTSKWVINAIESQTISGIGTISHVYGTNDNITSTTRYGVTTQYTYDSYGDVASEINARNYTISYTNYDRGVAQTTSEPQGVTITKVVNPMGTVASVRDGNGNTTSYTYDGLDRVTGITFPIHSPESISYSAGSISITRGSYSESLALDGFGRPVSDDRAGITVTYQYDALGHKTFESYPCFGSCAGRTYTVDALGRVTEINNNGATRSFSYGGSGSISVTTERGYSQSYRYNAYGNPDERTLVSVVTPTTSTTATYNAIDLMQSVSQNSLTRSYGYNSNYFLTSSIDPETGTTVFGRDQIGNLSSVTVASAGTTTYTLDGLNRRTQISSNAPSSSSTGPIASPTTTLGYDFDSNVTTLDGGCTNITYNYDAINELTSESHQGTCGGPTLAVTYGFDNLDHLSSVLYPSGRSVAYAPNSLGWPTTAGAYVTSASWYPNGYPQTISYSDGLSVTQTLSTRQLVNSLTATTKTGAALSKLTYGYDNENDVTSITDGVTPGNSLPSLTYDGDDQLTAATGPFGSASIKYDGAGNITTYNLGTAGSYTYGYSSNRLTSVTGTTNYTVTYDGQGNAINDGTYQYLFDSENRLQTVSSGGTTQTAFGYDGNGFPSQRGPGGGTPVYMFYTKGGQLLGEYSTNGSFTRENVYLGHLLVAYEITGGSGTSCVAPGNSTPSYLAVDPLGSPVGASDYCGNVVWQQQYLPYGGRSNFVALGQNDQWFSGHYQSYYGQLIDMGARQYSPGFGRYMSIDPAPVSLTNHFSFNRYAYGNNNPYRYVDPDGALPIEVQDEIQALKDIPGQIKDFASESPGEMLEDTLGALEALPQEAAVERAVVEGSEVVGKAAQVAQRAEKEITLTRAAHGEAAEHAADAIAAGHPDVLTIERSGADINRAQSTGGFTKVPDKHLDEYPPAMFKEGGPGASVRAINPRDNMAAGACIGNACRGLPDGSRVKIIVGN